MVAMVDRNCRGLYAYWVWRGFCWGGCVPVPPRQWLRKFLPSTTPRVPPYYSLFLPDIGVSAGLPSVRWRRKFLPSTTRAPTSAFSGPPVQGPTSVAESPASDLSPAREAWRPLRPALSAGNAKASHVGTIHVQHQTNSETPGILRGLAHPADVAL